MTLFVKHNLKKFRKQLSARPEFKAALWSKIRAEKLSSAPVVLWYQQYAFRLAVVLLIAFVVTTATGVYAYASPGVTEGTVLYPVKQTLEQVEEKLQTTPEKKAVFLLKQIDRREAEKKVLETKQQPVQKVNTAIGRVERKLEITSAVLEAAPQKDPVLLKKVAERLSERQERLEKIEERIEENQKKREERTDKNNERQPKNDVLKSLKRQENTTSTRERKGRVVPALFEKNSQRETMATSSLQKSLRDRLRIKLLK